jgi:transposase
MEVVVQALPIAEAMGRLVMQTPEDVALMLRLKAAGLGIKKIAERLGCSKNTVRRYVRSGGYVAYKRPERDGALRGLGPWLSERLQRHRGNADVVRQDLEREHKLTVSLRTVERAVAPFRRELLAADVATIRFETAPGEQLQIDFGETTVPIASERVRVHLFVATLGYSRRPYVAVFSHERQSAWWSGIEGAFHHFGGRTREVLMITPSRWWTSTTCKRGKSASTRGSTPSVATGTYCRRPVRRTERGPRVRTSVASVT